MKTYQRYACLMCLLILVVMGSVSCGVKVKEDDAEQVMQGIYKARKRGNIAGELRFYARKEFKIVPFEEVEATLYSVIGQAGRLKKVKPLKSKVQKRNQLGKGLTTYLVLSYEVTYTHLTLLESYYFYGDSEKPKLVYMTLQL
ncbi:MAG: hypothetical protein ACRBBR_16055 [Cellvibrionaceae bacterium]